MARCGKSEQRISLKMVYRYSEGDSQVQKG
ncbi:Bgt-50209 [Blumeria graminis f. sp. tritici]|uniref:Bgt-50209 n=1 Tax=Blumeria graminis f. sp. tritici TaxID=62690 RepID=A0A9X9MEP3_BLUGR|nr:Bgt-50209 [Blumeria graminis f. sp. tritici]